MDGYTIYFLIETKGVRLTHVFLMKLNFVFNFKALSLIDLR